MRHGEAVSVGMLVAARIAVAHGAGRGRAAGADRARSGGARPAGGLPARGPPVEAEAVWEAMGRDKKKQGRRLRWILPRRIGEVEIVEDVPQEMVMEALREMGAV